MFRFFSLRNKLKEKEAENKISSNIMTKLDRIIELLEQQQKEKGVRNIHFDTVQIEHLENIVFRLDNIEIDQLSGKLIIGNNISTTNDIAEALNLQVDPKNAKKETMSDKSKSNQKNIIKTTKGFRFHYDSK